MDAAARAENPLSEVLAMDRQKSSDKKRRGLVTALVVVSSCLLLACGGLGTFLLLKDRPNRLPESNALLSNQSVVIRKGEESVSGDLVLYESYRIELSFEIKNPTNREDQAILEFSFTSGMASNVEGFKNISFQDFGEDSDYSDATSTIMLTPNVVRNLSYDIPFYPSAITDSFSFGVSIANGDSSFQIVRTVKAK